MRRIYDWFVLISASVWFFAAGCFVSSIYASFERKDINWYCKNPSYTYQHHGAPEEWTFPASADATTDGREARRNAEQKKHELCQQWRSAKAAEDAAQFGLWQFCVASFGLLGLIGTVYYAAMAADGARQAAHTAERALLDLERPHVYVEITSTGLVDGRLSDLPTGNFTFEFVNHGRTPAIITELADNYVPVAGDPERDLPPPIDPSVTRGRAMPEGVIAPPSGAKSPPFSERPINVTESSRLLRQRQNLFFIGYVRYRDIFGSRYITGFCAVHDRLANRFVLMGDGRYNYTRKES